MNHAIRRRTEWTRRARATALLAASLVILPVRRAAAASDRLWAIAIDGGPEITITAQQDSDDLPSVDLRVLARGLNLAVREAQSQISIIDVRGSEWRTASGSVLLHGAATTRTLRQPVIIVGGAVLVPIETVAELAGRQLLVEGRRLRLTRFASTETAAASADAAEIASGDTASPSGWERLEIAKTAAELAETRRLEGDFAAIDPAARVEELLPPARDTLAFDVGVGFAQGASGALDTTINGRVAGFRVDFASFFTYGAGGGATYRSARLTLQDAAAKWTLEAGDLLSDVRGLTRGVRFAPSFGKLFTWSPGSTPWTALSEWHPSFGVYTRYSALSPNDRAVFAYRDEVRLPGDLWLRGEVLSDGSNMAGARWLTGGVATEVFYRRVPNRGTRDLGATVSYNLWRGVGVQFGGRATTGAVKERWYVAAVSVPVSNWATASVERTWRGAGAPATSAVGLQLPIGGIRVMQRYQWSDVATIGDREAVVPGARQLQSMASFSPMPRLQLSYQVATQWTTNTTVRQWTELQSSYNMSRSTSFHIVTGFPDVAAPERFRVGAQQMLPRGFRLTADYGALPAYQAPVVPSAGQDMHRFVVMVHRSFKQSTPAGGSEIRGRVVDDRGNPVAGAAVKLGPYVTTAQADGTYRFAHVPAGELELSLDTDHLPAQFGAGVASRRLAVPAAGHLQHDLQAIALHAIRGHVYIDRDGDGAFTPGEGVANVVMRLGPEAATMTDNEGAYGFDNLAPALYDVSVDLERLDGELAPGSNAAIRVGLDATGPRTGVDFRLVRKQKPTVLQAILP